MDLHLTVQDFLSVVGTTTFIVGLIGWALSIPYRSAIENGIRSSFDTKLEKLKGDLRKEEEAFKAEIKRKDDELSSLRSNVLSIVSNRHQHLDKRKLEAAESYGRRLLQTANTPCSSSFAKPPISIKWSKSPQKAGGTAME